MAIESSKLPFVNDTEDIVRVLRVIEYVGPRSQVESAVARSLHGERRVGQGTREYVIRAATVGVYPEILQTAQTSQSSGENGENGEDELECLRRQR
jgi:hypothetical protein